MFDEKLVEQAFRHSVAITLGLIVYLSLMDSTIFALCGTGKSKKSHSLY